MESEYTRGFYSRILGTRTACNVSPICVDVTFKVVACAERPLTIHRAGAVLWRDMASADPPLSVCGEAAAILQLAAPVMLTYVVTFCIPLATVVIGGRL